MPIRCFRSAVALVLFAFQAKVSRAGVAVRYVLTHSAAVTLQVQAPAGARRAAAVTVARGTGKAGLNVIRWNRRLNGRRAPRGRYRLTVKATREGLTTSSSIVARLRLAAHVANILGRRRAARRSGDPLTRSAPCPG